MQHKETGTELFKGGNWMHAAKHYKEGLGHAKQFFDLGPEDKAEVDAIKVSRRGGGKTG
jgi:hypothetical protein